MTQLDALRDQVRAIDRHLVELIASRIALAHKIGNLNIERTVLEHAEACAHEHRISEILVRSIMQQLIQESRVEQERLHYSAYQGDKERIVVIGGLGDMGKWFAYFFQNQGHSVALCDVRGGSDEFTSYATLKQGLEKASIVCIAVSLEITPLIIEEITDAGFSGIVFDVASLKGHLEESIARARASGIKITSIHPMFGPATRTLADKVFCMCRCGCPEADQKVEGLFKDTAVTLVPLSLQEHDRIISCVLGLSHLVNVIFIKTLIQGGVEYASLRRIASTTFLSQMITANSVIHENPHLYYAIQHLNPFKEKLYASLQETVTSISRIVLDGREEEFIGILDQARAWLEK
jgi:chorismate mutase/prephenate dehydrogenase